MSDYVPHQQVSLHLLSFLSCVWHLLDVVDGFILVSRREGGQWDKHTRGVKRYD